MGCINDPPRVSVTVCQQIITYLVTFFQKCAKSKNLLTSGSEMAAYRRQIKTAD